jgi:dihydrofolate synthase/folylpolyglutamate synthase
MTYKQTIEFLFSSLPMFQRIGDAAIKKDLTNIRLLCEMLDQPQNSFQSIHIAGTNGKGSTSHMLASIFQAAGKKVGLYTSPHYIDFRERIKINGGMIGEKDVIQFVKKYRDRWASIQPSFFEITVAMAFDYFRKEKVDIAIIETGLGGRLDSTNIINPKLSVITNIGFDHMQMLGFTLPEIASEKAGIIKHFVPVIIGEWKKETAPVFKKKALHESASIHFASRHLTIETLAGIPTRMKYKVSTKGGLQWIKTVSSDLTGPYQHQNIRTVLETLYQWNQYFPTEKIALKNIQTGLANVKSSTNMIGRWMVIRENPMVITDAAHNQHGMLAMLPGLLSLKVKRRHFVLGFVSDKDVTKILSMFPENGLYYWCSPDIPRGKSAAELKVTAEESNLKGEAFGGVMEAYKSALASAGKADLIFVGGSSYVVGDFLAGLQKENKKKSLRTKGKQAL